MKKVKMDSGIVKDIVILSLAGAGTTIGVQRGLNMAGENEITNWVNDNKYSIGLTMMVVSYLGLYYRKFNPLIWYSLIVVGGLQLTDDLMVRFLNQDLI